MKDRYRKLAAWIRWLQRIGGLEVPEEDGAAGSERVQRMIVGLGNPGPEYAGTRHNIGFRIVDVLARRWGGRFTPMEEALVAFISLRGVPVALVKPQTFMNLSGRAVRPLVHRFGLPLSHLMVVYDDMDLPLGTLRMRVRGSHGGHRGMRSVLEALESTEVPRLRFGIGRPPGNLDPAEYVLSPFAPEELEVLPQLVERAVRALELWVTEGISRAMQWLHAPVSEES